jgi:hypothetical protein
MKPNEPVNPRLLRTEWNAISFHGSTIAAEISGYADIGMKDEALRAVRTLLARRRILPEEFGEALRTIGIYLSSKTWKQWRPILEAAYNGQSRKFKRQARSDMLSMYASLGEWETALRFVELRKLSNSADVLFGMEVLLKLDKLGDARILANRCWKALRRTPDRFQQAVILAALGAFFSRTRRWSSAIEAWEAMPLEQPFRRDALSGIVKIHLAGAFEAVERGLLRLAELKKNPNNDNELVLPGNDEGLTRDAEKELLKFKRGIEKLLPEEARKELGIISPHSLTSAAS